MDAYEDHAGESELHYGINRKTMMAGFDAAAVGEKDSDAGLGTKTPTKGFNRTSRVFEDYLKPTVPSVSNYNSVL